MRRDVGRASIGASDGLRWTGDWLFYTHAARHGKVAFVADTLNYHRRHEGTVTAQVIKDDRWIREYLETKCRILESVPLSPDRIAESLARAVAEEQRIDAWQGVERPSFVDRPAFAPWRERLFRGCLGPARAHNRASVARRHGSRCCVVHQRQRDHLRASYAVG